MSKQIAALSPTNFKARLKTFGDTQGTIRDKAQAFIEFGLEFYAGEHADTTYLTQFMRACVGKRALNTKQILAYITAHANVKWAKTSDDSHVFKKAAKGEPVKVEMPSIKWFDWEKEPASPKKINPIKRVDSLIKALEKAIDEDMFEGDKVEAESILAGLYTLVSHKADTANNEEQQALAA